MVRLVDHVCGFLYSQQNSSIPPSFFQCQSALAAFAIRQAYSAGASTISILQPDGSVVFRLWNSSFALGVHGLRIYASGMHGPVPHRLDGAASTLRKMDLSFTFFYCFSSFCQVCQVRLYDGDICYDSCTIVTDLGIFGIHWNPSKKERLQISYT